MRIYVKYIFGVCLLVGALCPLSGQTGAHRIGQVLVKGNGIAANVVPYAAIKICVAGTQCSTISPVYSDQSLTHVLPQPISADASGNYNYYTPAGCVDEQISAPGSAMIWQYNVCPSTGTIGTGSVNSVSVATVNGFQGTVTNPTSTPVINMNVDGSHYLPTTSDESNWNGKQAALGFTPENVVNKDAASGYAGLTGGTLLKTAEFPALTGDVVSAAGTVATTLATVNSSPGVCGDATHVCAVTTNGKGLVTSQSAVALSGVTSVSSGGLSPLFTVSVATPSSTPAFTFTQSVAPINSVFAGAPSGSAAAPTFQTSPTFSGANLTNLNASSISSGTLDDGRLSSNIPLKSAANTFSGTQTATAFSATTAGYMLSVGESLYTPSSGLTLSLPSTTVNGVAASVGAFDYIGPGSVVAISSAGDIGTNGAVHAGSLAIGTLTNGTGLQTFSGAGCAIASGATLQSCNATLTLAVAEPDTSYNAVCTQSGSLSFVETWTPLSTTTLQVTLVNTTAAGSVAGTVNCIVTHN